MRSKPSAIGLVVGLVVSVAVLAQAPRARKCHPPTRYGNSGRYHVPRSKRSSWEIPPSRRS